MEYGWTPWFRDIAIIFMSLLVGFAGLAVIIVVLLIYRKLSPILDSLRRTAVTVQGTTAFMGEQAVTPVIRAAGFVSGVRRGFQTVGMVLRRRRPL